MQLIRLVALLSVASFAVAKPVGKAPTNVAARSVQEARAVVAESDLILAYRNPEALALEKRQVNTLLGNLVDSLIPLVSSLSLPLLSPLLATILGLVGSAIPLRDLQTGAKTVEDLSKETGVSVDDIKELFSHLPAGTISEHSLNPRQLPDTGGLVNSLIPLLNGIPVVGPIVSGLLILLGNNISLGGGPGSVPITLKEAAKQSGASEEDLKKLISLLPEGTIPGLDKRQLFPDIGGLLTGLAPVINQLPVVGPLLGTLLGLLGSAIPLRDLQSGAKTLEDLSKDTGVSLDDIKELFSHFPEGTIPGLNKRQQIFPDLNNLINGLIPIIQQLPIGGPLLANLLAVFNSNVPLRDLQSGVKSLEDVSKETGVSVDDLKEVFSYLPEGTIPAHVLEKRQQVINVSLLQSLAPLLNGIPLLGPVLSSVVGLLGSLLPIRELQSGAKTIQNVADETGVTVDKMKQILSLLPPGTIPGI